MPEDISPSEVIAQLQRIVADDLFAKSQRMGGFLRFVVEETLAGRGGDLKEYAIGMEVFERGAGYDPQSEPIVRIMAGRLRAKLAEYYIAGGAGDPIVIELPRGGYAPRFLRRDKQAASPVYKPAERQSVGRLGELARLRKAFDALGSGGRMVSVSGDAGMGKTTFVEDFLAGLAGTGVWVARGRSSERLAATDAFAPLLDALDDLRRNDSEAGRLLESTAPAWHAQVVMGVESQPASQERLRRELAAFFEQLARGKPVVLFLDDLHWADASTCDLLVYLGKRTRSIPVLVAATYRPGAVLAPGHPFLTAKLELEVAGLCEEIPLSFLTREDVAQYLDTHLPGHALPSEFGGVVWERTEGHPLFLADLIRYLASGRMVAREGGKWALQCSLDEIRRIFPAGAHAMIGKKLADLAEADRGILLCGAVQGMQFDSAVVAQVLARDPVWVEERLSVLERVHRLVGVVGEQDQPGVPLSMRYRFAHVYYQNALYALLTPSRRAADSLAVARAVACLFGERGGKAAELAVLYESGRDYGNAAQHFLRAGRNAARVFAYPEAALLCERGLSALAALPESRERDEQELLYRLTLGMALMSTRGYAAPEVEQTYRRARELCVKLKANRRLVPVLWAIHTCLTNAGRLREALEIAHEMRRAAESLGRQEALIESFHALGTTLGFMGRLAEARQNLERIFEIVPAAQHEFRGSLYVLDPLVTSLSMLARVVVLMGEVERGMGMAREAVELAGRLAHPHSLAYATYCLGWIATMAGQHETACAQLEVAMGLAETHQFPLIVEWGRVVRGSTLVHMGRNREGIAQMRLSLERQDAMGAQLERPYCLALLAEALLAGGGGEEALALCDRALALAERTGGLDYQAETRRLRGLALRVCYGETRGAEADGEFEAGRALARESGARLIETRFERPLKK